MTILIIGGGASGMMAALTASENPEHRVILAERQSRLGRKLLATGNGRCNLTNRNTELSHYHGEKPSFCAYALKEFDCDRTLAYFRSLGLLTVTEPSGRVYPYSDSANSVLDVLRLPLEQRDNVTLLTGREILSLRKRKDGFLAKTGSEELRADRVILCAGGLAGAKLGGTDMGYKLLAAFGHSRTPLYPSLVQLKTETTLVRSLKGVRCEALVKYGRLTRRGELQFTDYGVSGPVIFELSRGAVGGELEIDLLPDLREGELLALLENRCETLPQLKAEDLLTGILHNRLGRTILRGCGLSLEQPLHTVYDLPRVVSMCKSLSLTVQGTMGMDQAQVTAGGIRTEEFDPKTLESRLCPGLYAAGEVLDIDGDCGGYNLQWAWSSGRLAGELRGSL
jgi:predicted Rossmann fold flavoprotein